MLSQEGITYPVYQDTLIRLKDNINYLKSVVINEKGNYKKYDLNINFDYKDYQMMIRAYEGSDWIAGRLALVKKDYYNPFEFDILNGKLVVL